LKKLNDLLSFFYASAAVIYVSARDFGLIGTSIVLAVVLFMLYSTRIKAGCSAFVMLPFLLFFSIFVSMGTRRLNFGSSLYFFIVYAAILLSLSAEIWTAVTGLVLFGISLSLGGFSSADAVIFVFIVLLWFFTRNLKIPIIFLTLFPLLAIIILLSASGIELSITDQFMPKNQSASETPSATAFEESVPAEPFSNNPMDLNPSPSRTDKTVPGKLLFIPDFLLNFLLVIGAISMLFMIVKVKAFSGYLKILLLGTAIFAIVIAGSSSIFMFLNQTENKPITSGTGIGPQFSGKVGGTIPGVISETASSTAPAKIVNGFFSMSIEWILLIAASSIVVFTALALIKLMKKVANEAPEEKAKTKEIPEEIELLPLDKLPDLRISRSYILAAYWWLRRKYFSTLHHLTPYELLTLEKGETTFEELTEIYVRTKYAGRSPSKTECEKFHQLLVILAKRYESPEELNAYNHR